MNNCSTCASLRDAIRRAQAEHDSQKEHIMQILLDQHKDKQHQPPRTEAVVIWKDGTRWNMTQ